VCSDSSMCLQLFSCCQQCSSFLPPSLPPSFPPTSRSSLNISDDSLTLPGYLQPSSHTPPSLPPSLPTPSSRPSLEASDYAQGL